MILVPLRPAQRGIAVVVRSRIARTRRGETSTWRSKSLEGKLGRYQPLFYNNACLFSCAYRQLKHLVIAKRNIHVACIIDDHGIRTVTNNGAGTQVEVVNLQLETAAWMIRQI